eukprot:TRINITY_DN7409_c0_g4_i1.p1 TRINITY_DN7409_c0_g4~~TRINITY_DN7409_c0_g4_i1.p1  ORF type:complete len:167 (-),score=51.03 TRINITY_DN7409_c0_g4_i1:272-772(-)
MSSTDAFTSEERVGDLSQYDTMEANIDSTTDALVDSSEAMEKTADENEKDLVEDGNQDRDGDQIAMSTSAAFALSKITHDMINHKEVQEIQESQVRALTELRQSNTMLSNFNALSTRNYEHVFRHFERHTKSLKEMKSDLDSIHKRLRALRTKLESKYPQSISNEK